MQKSSQKNISITGKKCVGCRSCEQVCPTGCIVFEPDEEGFLYSKVEEEQCIRCGKCLRHCPVLLRREEERQPEMYGVRNKNAEHCSRSASAGVADMAAREIIREGGSVFGCAYTDEWKGIAMWYFSLLGTEFRKSVQCTSKGFSDNSATYFNTGKPKEIFGTNTPSIISICSRNRF